MLKTDLDGDGCNKKDINLGKLGRQILLKMKSKFSLLSLNRSSLLLLRIFLSALTISLTVFWLVTGGNFPVLMYDGWIGATDLAGAYGASLTFQADQWRFPLGANPNFGNTSIVFTDSIPLAALLVKAIAHFMHHPVFYFGPWFFLNIFATALVSLFLARRLLLPFWIQCSMSILFTANVVYLARMVGAQHLALSSTWLIQLSFLCTLGKASKSWWLILLLFTAGVHAYLLAMVFVFFFVFAIRQRWWLILSTIPLILSVWMYILGYGYPSAKAVAGGEFKPYGADLGLFFNSFNWGIIPELYKPFYFEEYDALLFIGSGGCLLIVAAFMLLCLKRFSIDHHGRTLQPLILPAIILLIIGTGLKIELFGFPLLNVPIPPPLDIPFRTFRAIGRFGWSATYLMILWATLFASKSKGRIIKGVLLMACVLQLLDTAHVHNKYTLPEKATLLEQKLELRELEIFLQCHRHRWNGEVYKIVDPLELEALQLEDALFAKHGARINISHSARQSHKKVVRARARAEENLNRRIPGLYIISGNRMDNILHSQFPVFYHRGFIVVLLEKMG